MRARFLLLANLAVLAALVAISAIVAAAAPVAHVFAAKPVQPDVDVELVLAVDVSYSMDPDEQKLQREGYVAALTSNEFLDALKEGTHGRIAVTYVEWAGSADQTILMPWRLIDGPASAAAVAEELGRAPYRRAFRTSISGGLNFSAPLFDTSPYRGLRRVIDVSGDGANNEGSPVTIVRDEVLARGITINGLPIMLKRAIPGTMDLPNLDVYYEDCVIGGTGSFVVPIRELSQFKEATRHKLVLEVAGRTPQARPMPASAEAPRISCMIGEQMWRGRWGGYPDFN